MDGRHRVWSILGRGLLPAIVLAIVVVVGDHVVKTEGNLAWDDADYLRRGLRLARHVQEDWTSACSGLLDERPKPPLYVAWIEASALIVGRDHLGTILLLATALPFGMVLFAAARLAVHRGGPRAGLLAVALIASSPMALGYGAKVMVETLLSLWLLAAVASASATVRRPEGWGPWLLGASIGLSAMTKATVVLFLPGLLAAILGSPRLRGLDRSGWRRLIFAIAVPLLAIAAPWMANNGASAWRFARHASHFSVSVEGHASGPSIASRPAALVGRIVGWPSASLVLLLAVKSAVRSRGDRDHDPSADPFDRIAILASAGAAVALLFPSHFDPRFLSPIWPAVAVALAAWGSREIAGRPLVAMAAAALLVLGGVGSMNAMLGEEPRTTHWKASALIDEIHRRFGVRLIVNVGDAPDWNVCKTGLINEYRRDPDDCHVLHDLSRLAGDVLDDRLRRAEALIVLQPNAIPDQIADDAPGLNRGLGALEGSPAFDRFEAIESEALDGLPPITVLIRRDLIDRVASTPIERRLDR